jgi:transposase
MPSEAPSTGTTSINWTCLKIHTSILKCPISLWTDLATTWTVPLLTAHLGQAHGCVVSERTLRRRLHEYGWRWKRPRYVYHERAPHVAQKKGRLSAA